MSFAEEYYANFGGLSIEEYVNTYIPREMNRIIATINLLPDDISSLLDVGAGLGTFLEELKKRRGIEGVGIEIVDAQIEYGRQRGVHMQKGNASNLCFPDKSFDAVVACEVIEHLPYGGYEAALAEFTRVARKYVIITDLRFYPGKYNIDVWLISEIFNFKYDSYDELDSVLSFKITNYFVSNRSLTRRAGLLYLTPKWEEYKV